MVSQLALLVTVHAQLPRTERDTVPFPPVAVCVLLYSDKLAEQEVVWLTVNVFPAIVSVPLRDQGPGFAAS